MTFSSPTLCDLASPLDRHSPKGHWNGQVLVGADSGVRFNARLGRCVKNCPGSVAWSDNPTYIQEQGYWIQAKWPMSDLHDNEHCRDMCRSALKPKRSNSPHGRSAMSKTMEHMAAEKPVVALDLPEHGFTAQARVLYVRPNDQLEFARPLVQLMDDPARRQAVGSFGRRRAETDLAWRRSIPKPLRGLWKAVVRADR